MTREGEVGWFRDIESIEKVVCHEKGQVKDKILGRKAERKEIVCDDEPKFTGFELRLCSSRDRSAFRQAYK